MLSPSDTAIVFLLALLLFGPEQLPKIARQVGEAMRHMQSTTQSFVNEMERAARTQEPAVHIPPPPLPPTTIDETPAQSHDAPPSESAP